jgi:thioredoxin 1
MNTATHPSALHVACLCAAWCRLCDDYASVFDGVTQGLRAEYPALHVHWIDIEDEAALLGDFEVETFPTLVVVDATQVRFAGPLQPQAQTLQRVLRATLADDSARAAITPALQGFASRLRQRVP